ncbi:hypothetical protein [Kitasatospora albolonga]|uniref:hypothetical protein n=1 Tax=Kitasatospora albolonga TaxID=68173 RepID=UPI0031E8CFB5
MRTSTRGSSARARRAAWAGGSRSPSRAIRRASGGSPTVASRAMLALFAPGVAGVNGSTGQSSCQERPGAAVRRSSCRAVSTGTCAAAAQASTRARSPGGESRVVTWRAPTERPRSTPGSPSA